MYDLFVMVSRCKAWLGMDLVPLNLSYAARPLTGTLFRSGKVRVPLELLQILITRIGLKSTRNDTILQGSAAGSTELLL